MESAKLVDYIGKYKTSSNDYVIEEEIGNGSFGIVYKALYKPTNQIVAIKDITIFENEELTDEEKEEIIEIILREIEILKTISDDCNEYFVCYIDYFINYNHVIIITNYLENYTPFSEILPFLISLKKGTIDEISNLMEFFLNISNGLKLLHSKGIAHRDLNFGNILLSINDITNIKIIDFGISCYKDKCETDIREGLYVFIDPKIIKSNKKSLSLYQQRDLWSLGIIIYKLIIDKYPLDEYYDIKDYYNNYSFPEDEYHDILIRYIKIFNNIYNVHLDLDNLLSQTDTRRYLK